MSETDPLSVGVIGVGSMGSNHARVYSELPCARLVGVADADSSRARTVATRYDTQVVGPESLLEAADAVSIAAPTPLHYELARAAIDRGVHTVVEKPFVDVPERGQDLLDRAQAAEVTLQIGHVERFNPAVQVAMDLARERDLVAIEAKRLGPPIDRRLGDSVVLDLMIHDIDVALTLVGDEVRRVTGAGVPSTQYVNATVQFENEVIAGFTASRMTQKKVRELSITTEDTQIEVDYLAQTVAIHRQAAPEYVETNGEVRHRQEQVTVYPTVEHAEPLKRELRSFVRAVQEGTPPVVDGHAGLRALSIARRIETEATESVDRVEVRAE